MTKDQIHAEHDRLQCEALFWQCIHNDREYRRARIRLLTFQSRHYGVLRQGQRVNT